MREYNISLFKADHLSTIREKDNLYPSSGKTVKDCEGIKMDSKAESKEQEHISSASSEASHTKTQLAFSEQEKLEMKVNSDSNQMTHTS